VAMELFPKRLVGDIGVPDNRAGIRQCDFFALGERVGGLKV
jgi:hypothetical protein